MMSQAWFGCVVKSARCRGTDQIGVEIQHKDRLLTDPGVIEDVLAVENDVVPFDWADVPQQPRGTI